MTAKPPSESALEAASAYAGEKSRGGCLIPRPGSELPSCHENDYCICELKEAFLAGAKWAEARGEARFRESELMSKVTLRLASLCPFNCYHEGAHPSCDEDTCDLLRTLAKRGGT